MKVIRIIPLLVAIIFLTAACTSNQAPIQQGENDTSGNDIATPRTAIPSKHNTVQVNVEQYTAYKVSAHRSELVGIVRNDGGEVISNVQLQGILLDGSSKIVGTSDDSSNAQLSNIILPPSQSAGFKLDIINLADWTSANVQVQASPYAITENSSNAGVPQPISDLIISNDNLSGNLIDGYVLSGKITNGSDTPAYLVDAAITAYDVNGKVIDVAVGYAVPSTLPAANPSPSLKPGDSANFEARFHRKGVKIERYTVIGIGAKFHGLSPFHRKQPFVWSQVPTRLFRALPHHLTGQDRQNEMTAAKSLAAVIFLSIRRHRLVSQSPCLLRDSGCRRGRGGERKWH